MQCAYELEVHGADGSVACHSGVVNGSDSQGVPLPPHCALEPGTAHTVRVRLHLCAAGTGAAGDCVLPFSAPQPFFSAPNFEGAGWGSASAVWHPRASASFVLLRSPHFSPPPGGGLAMLAVSARPTPCRVARGSGVVSCHGGNASKLLGAYTLFLNGAPLGTGPGRSVRGGAGVDMYNVTALLSPGRSNVLAIESAYVSAAMVASGTDPVPGDSGAVIARLWSPASSARAAMEVTHTPIGWTVFDGTPMMNYGGSTTRERGGGDYYQPTENFDMGEAPIAAWREPGTQVQWVAAAAAASPLRTGGAKRALPVSVRAVRIAAVRPGPPLLHDTAKHNYLVDFGEDLRHSRIGGRRLTPLLQGATFRAG